MFVYVLRSQMNSTRHYVGLTEDLDTSMTEHNSGQHGYTRYHRPWNLVVSLSFSSELKAREFERYLKTGSGRAFCRQHF